VGIQFSKWKRLSVISYLKYAASDELLLWLLLKATLSIDYPIKHKHPKLDACWSGMS